jgi:hypothetical protein
MMPTRTTTRAQNRANYITTERNHNRLERGAAQAAADHTKVPPSDPDEPPPF